MSIQSLKAKAVCANLNSYNNKLYYNTEFQATFPTRDVNTIERNSSHTDLFT